MVRTVVQFKDRDLINKCGLDAYFFLRYLKTLAFIFIPICAIVLPILIPLNYVDGVGQNIVFGNENNNSTSTTGLDTISWGNIKPQNTSRYTAHLVLAILTVIWVCTVFFFELKAYIKVRQDYLTSPGHRLRASANTVLVNGIPSKWLSEEALLGLFDVFPGGVRNIWVNRDFTKLLDKINLRDSIHNQLENAETGFIKQVKKAYLKKTGAETKAERKKTHEKPLTRKDKKALKKEQDQDAYALARKDGTDVENVANVPHTVTDGVEESQKERLEHDAHHPVSPLSNQHHAETPTATAETADQPELLRPPQITAETPTTEQFAADHGPSHAGSIVSTESTSAIQKAKPRGIDGNTVRNQENEGDLYNEQEPKFWQFWKPPGGGYISPVPQGESLETKKIERTAWQTCKQYIPFMGDEEPPIEYEPAFTMTEDEAKGRDAAWKQYVKAKKRPTHHLPLFGINWMFGMPGLTKKVDTIYWCRQELARLNMEIEEDQKHPERFPPLNSAFIQFNHQIAAHMSCQSVIHHIPRQMSPRMSEISPRDVVWGNMAMNWWQQWLRSFLVYAIIVGMVILWSLPVAATAALNKLDSYIDDVHGLNSKKHLKNLLLVIAGVLPTLVIVILLALVPIILNLLAGLKGVKTGSQRNEFVQKFYFMFLFIQLFLVVSIASFFAKSIPDFVNNLAKLQDVNYVLQELLAKNLPSASTYFFSYMILQALSTSSATLLQVISLFFWYIVGPMFDSTARHKWKRNTTLNNVEWGSFFPIYTNFACIALIYSIIAPLISVFAVITFAVLWIAQRYAMIYVYRFETDTGGVLYPRAINQAFTGLYLMELCMIGLFFITQDERGNLACKTQGIIMIVVFLLTVIYQLLLHFSFAPLFRYLPVTLEDEAVLRDEAFERAQNIRLGLTTQDDRDTADEATAMSPEAYEEQRRASTLSDDIELKPLDSASPQGSSAMKPVKQVGTWAKQGGKQMGEWAKGGGKELLKLTFMDRESAAAQYRRDKRKKDLESQQAIGDAVYGEIHDDIEDLTPEERDMLVKHAFIHYALRARRPVVWIPQDGLGVSDDEVKETREFSEYIYISNDGTALDHKLRVVYGKNPPDFSEVDVINL